VQPTQPQRVLTPTTEAAIFLVLTADAGSEDEVRGLLADVRGLSAHLVFGLGTGTAFRLVAGPNDVDST
jgi:porphyrinogen peroxidase